MVGILFFFPPLIDALNGFMIFNHMIGEGGLGSPTQIFRLISLVCMLFYVLNEKNLYVFLITVASFMLIEYSSYLRSNNTHAFFMGMMYSFKIVYALLFFLTIEKLLKNYHFLLILRFFRDGALLYVLILFASSIMGIDSPTYSHGTFGSKGLFASGNGLSIFLGTASVLAIYYYSQRGGIKNFVIFFILLVGTVFVGTKASIFFACADLLLLFYFSPLRWKYSISGVLCVIVLLYYGTILEYFGVIFDVIIFRYEHSDSLFSFLASNRDNYVISALNEFNIDGVNLLRLFIGAGVFISFRNYEQSGLVYDTLENDFFDIFFSYGLLGLLLYTMFILKGYFWLINKRNLILFVAWSAIVFYSLFAGHVVFNAMSNVALAIVYFSLKWSSNDMSHVQVCKK
jgi:hypothetical protein